MGAETGVTGTKINPIRAIVVAVFLLGSTFPRALNMAELRKAPIIALIIISASFKAIEMR